ncbi:uncharacterized protein B0H64DRAFT_425758 [Chaetomium fimeti]|uniref:Uncharacterized protein n=1 Tax=Chaetomium fimeti TaxID=1854472 RepID=A0AAE0HAY3_9PEZI|nr:hypothetical protein B0H64DRAFT_425758 [Chaetomium fimeti]
MTRDPERQLAQASGLLSLSPNLRRCIYHYLGVARFDGHPFTHYLDGRKAPPDGGIPIGGNHPDPPPASNFMGLLRSCPHRFVIFYSSQGSLGPLRALSPTSLASLTSLKIVLNESSCHDPTDMWQRAPYCCSDGGDGGSWRGYCARRHGNRHRRPLLDSTPGLDLVSAERVAQATSIMAEWHDIAAYLSPHIGVGRLTLLFEVTWSRQDRGYQVCRPPCHNGNSPDVHHGCRLSRCDPGDDHVEDAAPSPGCFCRRRHAAFSLICNCWCPPTNLFLVGRALRQEAEFVFFSHNRFIVHDFHASQPWTIPSVQRKLGTPDMSSPEKYYPFERYAASEFLRDIVPAGCLAHLRFLELVFPPYVPHGWPRKEHTAPWDWLATVRWIQSRVNAPALTIRLIMADYYMRPPAHRRGTTKTQATDILNGNKFIMHPLRALVMEDGLAGFYMEAVDPQRWNEDTLLRAAQEPGFLDRMRQHMKEIGEEYVRGKDASAVPVTNAKPEPRASTWQLWYELTSDSA